MDKISPFNARGGVQSLVREPRSYMPPHQKKQNIKQKQCYNKFNKDLEKKKRTELNRRTPDKSLLRTGELKKKKELENCLLMWEKKKQMHLEKPLELPRWS